MAFTVGQLDGIHVISASGLDGYLTVGRQTLEPSPNGLGCVLNGIGLAQEIDDQLGLGHVDADNGGFYLHCH